MIEIDEALRQILAKCKTLPATLLPVEQSVGHVLAKDVTSDVDSPPHDKALVDGFAVRFEDSRAGSTLQILELVVAGDVPRRHLVPGSTSQIMTGAPIPMGTDAMIMVEKTTRVDEHSVKILATDVQRLQNIMPKATAFAKDDVVLKKGTLIRPLEVGLLCEVGRANVECFSKPTVALLPTGDELVPAVEVPAVGQIRNSNGPMLASAAKQLGCKVLNLGVGRDTESELREQITKGLEADILVLSGGVSAGVRDLVPPTLKLLNVQEGFHQVRLKPGKPVWFGHRDAAGHRTLVFGLPGNPVSSLVCFLLFVKPAVQALGGQARSSGMIPGRLVGSFQQRGDRPTFFPGRFHRHEGRTLARPLDWRGSSDMKTLTEANCLIYFPAENREFLDGAKVEIYMLES